VLPGAAGRDRRRFELRAHGRGRRECRRPRPGRRSGEGNGPTRAPLVHDRTPGAAGDGPGRPRPRDLRPSGARSGGEAAPRGCDERRPRGAQRRRLRAATPARNRGRCARHLRPRGGPPDLPRRAPCAGPRGRALSPGRRGRRQRRAGPRAGRAGALDEESAARGGASHGAVSGGRPADARPGAPAGTAHREGGRVPARARPTRWRRARRGHVRDDQHARRHGAGAPRRGPSPTARRDGDDGRDRAPPATYPRGIRRAADRAPGHGHEARRPDAGGGGAGRDHPPGARARAS
jgi:hypothetical protein